jgi:type II restriction/modification system DNA methylase subunit YeeA
VTPSEFAKKWRGSQLKERSASQEHFIDLCQMLDHPTPAEADPIGDTFTFERGAGKHRGGDGWADVWKKGFFGWEYKGKRKDLDAAYDQLLRYRESLENPPLLVTCDFNRIIIHTNFTNTPNETHELTLDDIDTEEGLQVLRALFFSPENLKPGTTAETITEDAARHIAEIAQKLRDRGEEPHKVAKFLDRLVFCMFAEDIDLLKNDIFTRMLEKSYREPERFSKLVGDLFEAMAHGGDFGMDEIRHFNGELFSDTETMDLEEDDLASLLEAARLDWGAVDPSIFGTLFERGLDPSKRAQLGAHYTSREDIETLIEPVVLAPLRHEFDQARQEVEDSLSKVYAKDKQGKAKFTEKTIRKHQERAQQTVGRFLMRLSEVRVLDPACGSGNFLYVTLQNLKNLEKRVLVWAGELDLGGFLPLVHPKQLFGIELNVYAYDLAQMTAWIGYLQWIRINGFGNESDPILEALPDNFQNVDAILGDPEWPEVDFIVSNPPFLGGKMLRANLGDEYVDRLFDTWKGRVPAEADLVCYWYEKARAHIAAGACERAGLLATQGIRGGANRKVLDAVKGSGDIFFAESDRPWILEGANVHISMIGFDGGTDHDRVLDGKCVSSIHSNLTATVDISRAARLAENSGVSFMGDTKGGKFDLDEASALALLDSLGVQGSPASDVVVPWVNGMDITRRPRSMWIIDFGVGMEEEHAALYDTPFAHVVREVLPEREENQRAIYRQRYWEHVRPRPEMRSQLDGLPRFLATTTVSKYRLFVWMSSPTLPDHQLIVFPRADDYFMGVLQSRIHETWALRLGTRLETRPRYTPTTCFETFPFPWPLGSESFSDESVGSVAEGARSLDAHRKNWLMPEELVELREHIFPASVEGPWEEHLVKDQPSKAGFIRYTARSPEAEKQLKKRTLTNLYNENPRWLQLAHEKLDAAVIAAYAVATGDDGWVLDMSEETILERLLGLNAERA